MSIEKLKAYESKLDAQVNNLSLLKLPVRPLLVALHMIADNLFNGSRLSTDVAARPEVGDAAAGRYSYLVPLLMNCVIEPLGSDADNALQAVVDCDPDQTQLRTLLGYGHFCELMPEVHRGYYSVEGDEEVGFELRHPATKFSADEALDTVLTELSLPVLVSSSSAEFTELFDGLAQTVPLGDGAAMGKAFVQLNNHYREFVHEPPLLSEEGCVAATGASIDEFVRFRAAICAMADFARGMASAVERRIRREGDPETILAKEMLEWISVCWKDEAFFGFLEGLSGLEFEKLERLVSLFSIDFRSGRKMGMHARDGFFPPIARLESAIVYNPNLVKVFLTARNILFAVRHQDQTHFDQMVSSHLEPTLVVQAVNLLKVVPGLEIIIGHKWGKGDIDILVYSASENAALHVQAKAAIPPQGARMVQAIEGRIREGLDQLKRFRDLPTVERDQILSQALGRPVNGVEVFEVLLSRSCFGTSTVWSGIGNAIPLNLTLLAGVTKSSRVDGTPMSLRGLATQVQQEIIRVMQLARPQWVMKEALLGPVKFRIPMLDFDNAAIRKANLQMWKHTQ